MNLSDIFSGLFVLFIVVQVLTSFGKKSGKKRPKAGKTKQASNAPTANNTRDFEARLEKARARVREAMSENSPSHSPQQHVGSERADELFHGSQSTEHLDLPGGFSKKVVLEHKASMPQGLSGHLDKTKTIRPAKHLTLPGGLGRQIGSSPHQSLPQGLNGHLDSKYFRPELEVGLDKLESHHSKHVKLKHYTKRLTTKKKKTVKLDRSVIQLDADSIVSGIIWHQILSEPKFKQNWRN